MDAQALQSLATDLMQRYGLIERGWSFRLGHGRLRFGSCRYSTRTIKVSRTLAELNSDWEVRDTILHEIAHALVGPGNGHGRTWKLKAVEVGAKPQRCYGDHVKTPAGKWTGKCVTCGREFSRHRTPVGNRIIRGVLYPRRYWHVDCQRTGVSQAGLIQWTRNEPVTDLELEAQRVQTVQTTSARQ